MKKSEYLNSLAAALKTVEKSERERYLAYYSELIDDRIDEGCTEAEAVAGLESIDAAALRILAAAREQGKIKKGLGPWAIAAIAAGSLMMLFLLVYTPLALFTGYTVFSYFGKSGPVVIETSFPAEYELREESFSADMTDVELNLIESYIVVEPSPDEEFHLRYYTCEDYPLELIVNTAPDRVKLEDTRSRSYSSSQLSDLFSARHSKTEERTVTLQVPGGASGRLGIANVSGDIVLYDTAMGNSLEIATVSGGISIDTISFRNLNLATVSGGVNIANANFDGVFAASTSGDIALGNLTAGEINAANVSGGIRIYNSTFTKLYCNTVSGDLDGTLLGAPEDYKLAFASLSGHNSLSGTSESGGKFIEFASVSGSLNLQFE